VEWPWPHRLLGLSRFPARIPFATDLHGSGQVKRIRKSVARFSPH
jgi:hypothetical protein